MLNVEQAKDFIELVTAFLSSDPLQNASPTRAGL
jgi:hypothetical protein